MKRDIRVQYPLWQMGFIVLFGAFAWIATTANMVYTETESEMSLMIETGIVLPLLLIVFIVLLTIFSIKIHRHNQQHPNEKVSMWQGRPPEFLEQDEGMAFITRKAVQKVYTFFFWALPLLAVLYLFIPFSRFSAILGLLFLAFMQNLIYYKEIRSHLKGEEE